jgi:hypothetical protein
LGAAEKAAQHAQSVQEMVLMLADFGDS